MGNVPKRLEKRNNLGKVLNRLYDGCQTDMKKKIKVEQLRPGMYIDDFNCSWMDHPFLFVRMKVRNEKIIKKTIDSGIREVYIDTDRGLDIVDALTQDYVEGETQTEIENCIETEAGNVEYRDLTTVKEEWVKAREIIREANQTARNIMEDIKLGKHLEVEKVNHLVVKMVDSIMRNKDALVCLGRIRHKDEYTFVHSVNVCVLMISFSKYLGLDYNIIKEIGTGGLVHDIGKMKLPVAILNKPGKLTESEFNKAKEHVEYGCDILRRSPGINETSVLITAQHHEKLDGTGYPRGLKGEEISKVGQMAAIADIYDALTSDRCYKNKILPTMALKELFELRESHFNGLMVEQFISCVGIYPIGTLVRLRSGLLAVVVDHGGQNLLQPRVRVIYDTKKEDFISRPYEIDLWQQSDNSRADSIVSYESPNRINIMSETYL